VKDQEIDGVLKMPERTPHHLAPQILRRIGDSIKTSLRPVRPLPPGWVMTCGLVLVCAAISLMGAARAGFIGFEKMDPLERLLIFPALIFLIWMAGSEFVHAMIPGSLRRISSGALLGFGCAALLIVFAFLFRDYRIDHFFSAGIACLLTGFVHAIPASVLGWLLLRRGFAVNSVSAGLAAGTFGGLAGVVMLELHCPNFQVAHVLVWHIAVVPLSAAAGALVAWTRRFCETDGGFSSE